MASKAQLAALAKARAAKKKKATKKPVKKTARKTTRKKNPIQAMYYVYIVNARKKYYFSRIGSNKMPVFDSVESKAHLFKDKSSADIVSKVIESWFKAKNIKLSKVNVVKK